MRRTASFLFLLSLSLAACGDDDDGDDVNVDGGLPDGGTPDGGDVPLERAQAGGEPSAMVREQNTLYVTIGPRLTIWDVTDPAAPEMLGETDPLNATATGVTVLGDHAYVTDRADLDGQLHVIDVSDPAAPEIVKSLRVGDEGATSPEGVTTDGVRVFVADREQGIAVVDVTDPAQASVSEVIPLPGATDVVVAGNRLYGVSNSFLGGVNFDAFDLIAFDALGTGGVSAAIGYAFTDEQLLVTTGSGGTAVFDLTDLDNVDQLFIDDTVGARAVAIGDGKAWVPADDGVYTLTLGETPALSGPTDLPVEGANQAVAVDGVLSVISDRGRLVNVDVAGATPTLEAAEDVSIAGNAIGVAVAGNRVFVGDGAGGLRVGQLSDLAPLGRGYPDEMADFEDVVVDGDFIYVADWFYGLRIYQVEGSEVNQVGSLDTPGAPAAVAVEDGIAYLGESTGGGAVRVIDVSDPTSPEELGAIETAKITHLVVKDKIVYAASETLGLDGGLLIIDATTPATPTQVGLYVGEDHDQNPETPTTCALAYGVALAADDVVITGCIDEFHLVDVSTKTAPSKIATVAVPDPNATQAVAIAGDVAFLGHDGGVMIVDISTPASPNKTGDLNVAWSVRDLDASIPGRLVAAAGLAGLYQWTVP